MIKWRVDWIDYYTHFYLYSFKIKNFYLFHFHG